MQCPYPISLKNPKYHGFGNYITQVPCGKCMTCLSNRRREWVFRLKEELKSSSGSYFITLTYDDDHIPLTEAGVPTVSKRDVQLFMKRLRKTFSQHKLRFFLVSEYGTDTLRPHYHLLLFNLPIYENIDKAIQNCWCNYFGNIYDIGEVTGASISYCAKYCLGINSNPPGSDSVFMLCSRRPGIGCDYITDNKVNYYNNKKTAMTHQDGSRVQLPRYYRNKVLSDDVKRTIASHNIALAEKSALQLYDDCKEFNNSKNDNTLPMEYQIVFDRERCIKKVLHDKSKL